MGTQKYKRIAVIDRANPGLVLRTALPRDLSELAELVVTEPWAPAIYSSERRSAATASQSEIIALDIDEGCSLEAALELFKDYKHIIATTKSHRKPKNGIIEDRFRVILFLSRPVTSPQVFKATFMELAEEYGFVDRACSDISRFFYPSVEVISVNESGNLIEPSSGATATDPSSHASVAVEPTFNPEERGRLSYSTISFLKGSGEAGEPGRWNSDLYKAAKDFQEQRFPKDVALRFFRAMTNENYSGALDATDLKTIDSAFASAPKYQPRKIKGES